MVGPPVEAHMDAGRASGRATRLEPGLERVAHLAARPSHVILPVLP